MTDRHSTSVAEYFLSGGLKVLLAYAITRSLFWSSFWERIAPRAKEEASVYKIKGFSNSGYARIGGDVKHLFNRSKASCWSCVQMKGVFFLNNLFKGSTILAKPFMNLL